VPELFPTTLRMRGVGLCSTTGRLANVGIPFLVTMLYVNYGLTGVLGLISAGLILQAAIVASIGIETRGRSLEEVDSEKTCWCYAPSRTEPSDRRGREFPSPVVGPAFFRESAPIPGGWG
jgi:hypothetical protein